MSATFSIQPIGRFTGQSQPVKRPKEFACFSYDENHEFRLDDSSMKYYYTPQLGTDLSKGFDKFQKLDDSGDEHLDSLLKTILAHERETGKKIDANVVTWRGMMTKIMAALFEQQDGFEMNATLYQDCIFIEENNEYKLQSRAKENHRGPRRGPPLEVMQYWVWDSKPQPGQPINWVELKTTAEIRSDHDMDNFHRKLMKFWIQSFLLGVPKIIVGFRTRDGILVDVKEIETHNIPQTVNSRQGARWNADMCVNFAGEFLEFLQSTINDEGVWRIRRHPASPTIEVFKVEETGHGNILSDEFKNWRIKLSLGPSTEP
ncbi:RAI1 protein [Metarhizium guizhouense ARSEF 977]|uniref:Decapping nuclease n=1 Tax=Metarhizium guizhouense (strain ARSEF 977) TaxID=1276136 RepID=A0A0B4GNX1_METGA|nr:RAI1 protein [Metarhizium guizhouense ARSEF 977]